MAKYKNNSYLLINEMKGGKNTRQHLNYSTAAIAQQQQDCGLLRQLSGIFK